MVDLGILRIVLGLLAVGAHVLKHALDMFQVDLSLLRVHLVALKVDLSFWEFGLSS